MGEADKESVGAAALRQLEKFLAEHPLLKVERGPGTITVLGTPETGFDVTLTDLGSAAKISCLDYQAKFGILENAAETFMWFLTPEVRMVVSFRGRHPVGWKLQWLEDGKWTSGARGASILALLPLGPKREVILQNTLLNGS